MVVKTCPGCGTDLAGTHGKRIYCSTACRKWVVNGHTELRIPAATNCRQCSGPIVGKMVTAVYCSKKCKTRAVEQRRVRDDAARYQRERDRRIQYATDYARRNPHIGQVSKRNRRAAASGSRIRTADWLALCRRFGLRCAYCSVKAPLTMDHVVPLVRGGSHTIGNILPACKRCNCRKQGRFIMEWRMGKSRRGGRRNAVGS